MYVKFNTDRSRALNSEWSIGFQLAAAERVHSKSTQTGTAVASTYPSLVMYSTVLGTGLDLQSLLS